MNVALIILLPFLGAVLPALMIRSGRDACATVTGAINALALALLLAHAPEVLSGGSVRADWSWISRLGLNIQFSIDALGLLFGTIILGVGLLVVLYARYYLSADDPMGSFYAYLLLFQGAMIGIVLSNNVLQLLVFWELTSLSSFLLIGFWGHSPAGRQGARMALTITGGGGLALIAGLLLLGKIVGSYELTTILASGDVVRASPLYPLILGLILLGCFTKSAQFPFHFWLPHAMAAPTPVSAYLHSATMVKAGIYLMARLWPVLSGTELWFYVVTFTGLVTMLLGAVIALFKDDLKGVLAYSTVSHLGLMTMLLGFSSPLAVVACMLHLVNHATFKAALFLNTGIIDHETGTRDISLLGGLRKYMPATAICAVLAAASMGGLPPLNGFLSKEMMLEEAAHRSFAGSAWLLPVAVTVASVCSFAYSLRYVTDVFFGKPRQKYPQGLQDPGIGLWLSPTLLVALVILIGLFPETMLGRPVRMAAAAAIGGEVPKFYLALWHGVTPALIMSGIAIGAGALLLLAYPLAHRGWNSLPRVAAKPMFDFGIASLAGLSKQVTGRLHNSSLQRYLFVTLVASLLVGGITFAQHWPTFASGTRSVLPTNPVILLAWVLLIAGCILVVKMHANRLVALLLVNLIGLMTSLIFVYFSAPDLALTQISVEVVTLILMLLALYFLPKHSLLEATRAIRVRNGLLSIIIGLAMGGLTWAMLTRDFDSISNYYWEQSLPGSGGRNVVNVILVDFRGFDTFGEIMVLGIAALIIFALLDGLLNGPMRRHMLTWTSGEQYSPTRHPLVMVVVTRLMLPLSLMVAAFIFLRGHNEPGGGFIAALVVSIALIMQYMASGFGWAARRVRVDYHALIGGGVLIAAATGITAMVFDRPFLTSGFKHFHWPVGDFELSSALAFDLGIFMTVLGGVMLALAQFSKLGEEITGEQINEAPMDYPPGKATVSATPLAQGAKRAGHGQPKGLPANNPNQDERI